MNGALADTCDEGPNHSRLILHDNISNMRFLIDKGADISVLPSTAFDRQKSVSVFSLLAANGSPIHTYGQKRINVSLGLRRDFPWLFKIADVSRPIIGSDFLKHYNLLRGRVRYTWYRNLTEPGDRVVIIVR